MNGPDCRDEINLFGQCSASRIRADATHTATLDNHTDETLYEVCFIVAIGARAASLQLGPTATPFPRLAYARHGSVTGYGSAKSDFELQRVGNKTGSETVATTATWTDRDSDAVFDQEDNQEYFFRSCKYTVKVG
jgi:hypothetical protein